MSNIIDVSKTLTWFQNMHRNYKGERNALKKVKNFEVVYTNEMFADLVKRHDAVEKVQKSQDILQKFVRLAVFLSHVKEDQFLKDSFNQSYGEVLKHSGYHKKRFKKLMTCRNSFNQVILLRKSLSQVKSKVPLSVIKDVFWWNEAVVLGWSLDFYT